MDVTARGGRSVLRVGGTCFSVGSHGSECHRGPAGAHARDVLRTPAYFDPTRPPSLHLEAAFGAYERVRHEGIGVAPVVYRARRCRGGRTRRAGPGPSDAMSVHDPMSSPFDSEKRQFRLSLEDGVEIDLASFACTGKRSAPGVFAPCWPIGFRLGAVGSEWPMVANAKAPVAMSVGMTRI